jgi:hypothetical protein
VPGGTAGLIGVRVIDVVEAVAARRRDVVAEPVAQRAQGRARGLCGYTRARCYSPLIFVVTIEILHIKEIGEGQWQKALV